MKNRSEGIPCEEYFARLEAGIPYEGPVIGLGYAIKEIMVPPISINESQTQTFLHLDCMNVIIPYSYEYLEEEKNKEEKEILNNSDDKNDSLIDQGLNLVANIGSFSIGGLSTYYVHKGEYLLVNELWRHQPSGKQRVVNRFSKMSNGQSYWKNNIVEMRREQHLKRVSNIRKVGNKISIVGVVFIGLDVYVSGEIKPSQFINTGLIIASTTTGVGSIVAGVWFIFDYSTMGVNYLINGEAKGLGDIIDEKVGIKKLSH